MKLKRMVNAAEMYREWDNDGDNEWVEDVFERRGWYLKNGYRAITGEDVSNVIVERESMKVRCFCYACGCYGGQEVIMSWKYADYDTRYDDGVYHTGHNLCLFFADGSPNGDVEHSLVLVKEGV